MILVVPSEVRTHFVSHYPLPLLILQVIINTKLQEIIIILTQEEISIIKSTNNN